MNYVGDWGTATPAVSYTPYNSSSYKHSGANSVFLQSSFATATSYTSPRITRGYVISPIVNSANMTTLQVSFWVLSSRTNNKLYFGVMSDPDDPTTFEEVMTINVSRANVWEEFVIPLTGLTSTGKHVAFLADGADGSQSFYVDDVVVETIPACPKNTLVRTQSVGADNAVFSWISSNATRWQVIVNDTLVAAFDSVPHVKDTIVTSLPATILGLTPQTDYYIYVRSLCGASDTSAWSEYVGFTTHCVPVTEFPYVEN